MKAFPKFLLIGLAAAQREPAAKPQGPTANERVRTVRPDTPQGAPPAASRERGTPPVAPRVSPVKPQTPGAQPPPASSRPPPTEGPAPTPGKASGVSPGRSPGTGEGKGPEEEGGGHHG